MHRPLALPVGDPAGVGPRVSVAAAQALGQTIPCVLFGDFALLQRHAHDLGVAPLVRLQLGDTLGPGAIGVVDTGVVSSAAIDAHAPTREGGEAQWQSLLLASQWVQAGRARGLVTAPVSKEAIVSAGHAFTGQTEFLAQRTGLADDDVTMMFLGPRLNVALVTTHLSVRQVPDAITVNKVSRSIRHLAQALTQLKAGLPHIAVSGLNPHAGEGGLFGDEETLVVRPAIEQVAAALADTAVVRGPVPAEAVFRAAQAGDIDGVVAMFHDQATIASKLLDWGSAVNVTWGLPFVRTSVDHGVAYDAARDGCASDEGMRAAVLLGHRLTESLG